MRACIYSLKHVMNILQTRDLHDLQLHESVKYLDSVLRLVFNGIRLVAEHCANISSSSSFRKLGNKLL